MIIFLVTSLALRLIGFTSSAIWYDEALSLYRAQNPLVYSNLWEVMLRAFAHGPLWLFRLPALICSMASLWLAWLIMDELKFNQRQRITACIFMAAMPGLIWMSQDARYYAGITVLSMLTIYLALRHHWAFGISFGLMASVHPVAPAYGIVAFAIALLTHMQIRKLLNAALIGSLMTITNYVIYFQFVSWDDISTGSTFWLPQMNPTISSYSIVQAFFVNTLSPWLMIAVLTWLILLIAHAFVQPLEITALMFITPLTAITVVSLVYQNVFFYRTLMPLAIPLCLWIGWAHADGWAEIVSYKGLMLLAFSLASFNPAARGYYIEHASTRIRDAWRDGDRIVYDNGLTAMPFDYYLHDHAACVRSRELLPPGSSLALCDYAADGREWIITSTTTQTDGILFERLWPWQVTPIEIHLVDHKAISDDGAR